MKKIKSTAVICSALMLLSACNVVPADEIKTTTNLESSNTTNSKVETKTETNIDLKNKANELKVDFIDTYNDELITIKQDTSYQASKEYKFKVNLSTSDFDIVLNKVLNGSKKVLKKFENDTINFSEKIPGTFKYSIDVLEKGTDKILNTKEINLQFKQSSFSKLTTKFEAVPEKSKKIVWTPLERTYIYTEKNDKSEKVWKIIPGQFVEFTSERDANGWVKLKVLGQEGYTNFKNFVQVPILESNGKTDKYLDYSDAISTKKMMEIMAKLSDKDNARIASTPDEYAAGDWIIEEMKKLGYTSKRYPFKMPRGTWLETPQSSDTSNNIISTLPNYDPKKKDIYFIGHYDSVTIPGANDNASAVAMNMEIARYLTTRSDLNFNPVIFFPGCEEIKMTGSWTYVEQQLPNEKRDNISLIINSDMIARRDIYQLWAIKSENFNKPHQLLVKDIALNLGLKVAQIVGFYTDNVAFETYGVNSVSFLNINDEQYHTDLDVVENASEEVLMNFGNIILNLTEIQNMKLGGN